MKKGEQPRENFNIITAAEFQDNQHELTRISQNTSFKEEINNLKQKKHVKPSSSIAPMSPFINSAGLLCIGGRSKTVNIPYLNKHQIKWQFNPPLSPWMGGCWESLIKTKRCLYAILKNSITTAETLTTVICEVEYIVNNHPLLPISDDINDYDVLTPNNFLLGYKSPDVNIGNGMQTDQIDYRQKWKQVQNTANMYWNRWLKEYIPNPHKHHTQNGRDKPEILKSVI